MSESPTGSGVPPTDGLDGALADLLAERARLTELLREVAPDGWRSPFGSAGWTVADHVVQLALLDEAATLAVTAPQRFATHARSRTAGGPVGPAGDWTKASARAGSGDAPSLLRWLVRAQRALVKAYRPLAPDHTLPWYGTELDAATALTARLAETWVHGWDLATGLGTSWPATGRLRVVADLAVRSLGASFEQLGRPAPTVPVRVELTGPDDERWVWGPEHARDQVSGAAEDLCLVLAGRRRVEEVPLRVSGVVVAEWLAVGRGYPGAPDPAAFRRPPGGTSAVPDQVIRTS
jgi:uncharacterized protein (TIGR03084 family)